MAEKTSYTKRFDSRKNNETRKIKAEVGVVPRADGSALFAFGDTIAIAAVYGPREFNPRHMQDPEKGVLRVHYDMLSFSVTERKKPGPSRRSTEISKVTQWALAPVIKLENFPNKVVDVHISILQANASTRVAGINAASMALAHAGIPMTNLITSVSVGKIDKTLVVDVCKDEEDYEEGEGATDIAVAMDLHDDKITLLQLDGKINKKELKEAISLAKESCREILEEEKKALRKMAG
jgi:exosome complex component RRP41